MLTPLEPLGDAVLMKRMVTEWMEDHQCWSSHRLVETNTTSFFITRVVTHYIFQAPQKLNSFSLSTIITRITCTSTTNSTDLLATVLAFSAIISRHCDIVSSHVLHQLLNLHLRKHTANNTITRWWWLNNASISSIWMYIISPADNGHLHAVKYSHFISKCCCGSQ